MFAADALEVDFRCIHSENRKSAARAAVGHRRSLRTIPIGFIRHRDAPWVTPNPPPPHKAYQSVSSGTCGSQSELEANPDSHAVPDTKHTIAPPVRLLSRCLRR